jgi:protein TonB
MAFTEQDGRERAASAAAVILCHALIAYVLISGFKLEFTPPDADPLAVFEARSPPPPPPPEETIPLKARAKAPEGEASPPNLKAAASPIVAPKPEVPPDVPSPVAAAAVPRDGPDRSAGAASVPGPGTGSGGSGQGTGSGGSGSGSGSGDGDGTRGAPVRRARQIAGNLSLADYPSALRRAGIGGRVEVHMTVEPSGRVSRCTVARSSGSAELDATTCRLVRLRYLFDPARDARGRAVRDLVGESHVWTSGRRGR